MSLSAVVYKNSDTLAVNLEAGGKKDPTTGQYYFDSPEEERRFPKDFFVAADWWIGNVSSVAELRAELENLAGTNDLLLIERCLYSGSHSGDTIEPNLFATIEKEILQLRHRLGDALPESIERFFSGMLNIIQIAKRENNPIVFV